MGLVGRAFVLAAQVRGAQLDARSRHPRSAQERALRRLIERAKNTAFGRAHRLAKVRSVADFRAAVPVRDYLGLKSWIERALEGEKDCLWPGAIPYFGMSSGTTAGNKYLPISHDQIRSQRRHGFDPIASYLRATRDASLFEGVGVFLGSSSTLTRHPSGAYIGDNTGIMAHHVPGILSSLYRPTPEVRRIPDWDRKIDALVRESLDEDVRFLAGTPSWFPGLFDRLLDVARTEGRKADVVLDLWPNLRLLTGGGVRYEPYRALIEARLGRKVPYVDVYNATEGGFFGVQDRLDDEAMRLLPDTGVFFEFVPIDQLDRAHPERRTLWEVETGVTYAVVVSTPSGLLGYRIGDCVRFVERFPHRFFFEGRTAAFLNVQGEHVSQGELERAMRVACLDCGVELVDFTVTAEVGIDGGSAARHVYFVEVDGALADSERMSRRIDADLRLRNDDYGTHRESRHGLRDPEVRLVARGTFHRWMKSRGKLGGQNKVPRVILDPLARSSLETCALEAKRGSHELRA